MNIKYLLVFCLGAVTGSVFAAKFLDERYSKIADEEIESVKEVAKKTIDDLKEKISNVKKEANENCATCFKKSDEEYKINDGLLYHNITNSYGYDSLDKPKDKDIAIEDLTEEQFSEGDNEKMTVWFYGQDKALINDDDQPIDNAFDCVGKGIINEPENYFHFPDKTTLYIRNHTMGIDFEVIYLDKSYSRDVLGLED